MALNEFFNMGFFDPSYLWNKKPAVSITVPARAAWEGSDPTPFKKGAFMVKLVALMKIRNDISTNQARQMYEEEHVPLVMTLMPMIRDYRRNYLDRSRPYIPASENWPDFDVVTELWFDSMPDLEAFLTRMREGEDGRLLRADSARFLQAGTTRMFVVDEAVTMRD